MDISRVMTHNPFTVFVDTPVTDAQAMMRREKIHRLPVLAHDKRLAGIVSEKDLLYASPSPATTLDVYEMANLLSKLKVEQVMTRDVVTVEQETLLEDAARIMVDANIGGLPVMSDGHLVGIVTESDIFKLFIELFGTRRTGLRCTLLIPERVGELASLASAIAEAGGNIISLGTFPGEDPTNAIATLKVDQIERAALLEACSPFVEEVLDIRET
jgi:acetoin utilization protein AcuB